MKQAQICDVPRISDMGRAFHEYHRPQWQWDGPAFRGFIAQLIQSDFGYVAVTNGGFIAAVIQPNPISPDWIMAKEFLWWARDGKGARLLAGFRKWARDGGAHEVQFSCPPNSERVKGAYGRIAAPTEIIYSEFV